MSNFINIIFNKIIVHKYFYSLQIQKLYFLIHLFYTLFLFKSKSIIL
jgi:hypothetical protein